MYITVNLSQDAQKTNKYLSNTLLKGINTYLQEGKKIIIYLNKRGDYSALVCKDCQHFFQCERCDTALSVHEKEKILLCHFCSFSKHIPQKCPNCNWVNLLKVWIWTKQIETSLNSLYPQAHIFRFDHDSVKNISSKKKAISELEDADIIIGTKMITTWIDLKNIWLIAVVLLEQELMTDNFDAEEEVYINIKQLSWRTREKECDIIIQSFIPDNPLIQIITEKNYKDFFKTTLEERKKFELPPFYEKAILEFRSPSKDKSITFMKRLKNKLDILNSTKDLNIILSGNIRKKYNQYYCSIHIWGKQIKPFLENIRAEIIKNSYLSIRFD